MRIIQSSIFRALCAVIIGALLIKYTSDTVTWIIMAIGGLFLLSGIISILVYYTERKRSGENRIYDAEGKLIVDTTPAFPIVGLGSVILGFILFLMPTTFINTLTYILGAILILGGINQIINLIIAGKIGRIPLGYWICPTLITLLGIIALIKPMWIVGAPFIIIGWSLILYGVTEAINAIKMHKNRKANSLLTAQQTEQSKEENSRY